MPSPTTRTNSWNIAKQQDSKTLKLRQIPGSYHTILLHIHNALCAFVARPDEALGHLSVSPPNGEKLKGDESLNFLKDELKGYGPVVLLNYGSGSVKRNGIYDQVVAILKEAGKTIVENPGVMTNPTLEKLHEGV